MNSENLDMVYGNGLLLVLVILEACFIKYKLKEELPLKELIMNLNSGHILLWIFRGLEVAAYVFTLSFFNTGLADSLPKPIVWIIAFFLWDFMFYWLHRTHHIWKLLWSVHIVHHEGAHFSLSLGIRNSWYSSLTSFPYFIIMALLGIPTEIFIAVSSFHYFVQFYNHNHLIKYSGFLEKIMITPAHHKVHHGKNDPYLDKNFGGTFIFWDKLFGTFQKEDPSNPVILGVDKPVTSHNPILVNHVPVAHFIGKSLRYKVGKMKLEIPKALLISGAIALFLMLLLFIFFEGHLSTNHTAILFTTVFVGTISNGLILDGKLAGFFLWVFSNILAPIYILLNFENLNAAIYLVVSSYLLHGIITMLYLGMRYRQIELASH